jgi:hypothetical protein
MIRLLVSALALCLGFLVLAANPSGKTQTIAGTSYALLIGVNRYPHLPAQRQLTYPTRDVEELKTVLIHQYGLAPEHMTVLTNEGATLQGIHQALTMLCDSQRIKRNDRLLIFFSGHGQTVRLPNGGERGFLLPTDARVDLDAPGNAAPYLQSCLSMDALWDYLDASPAKHALILVDACYSGFLTQSRGALVTFEEIATLAARPARQVITAGRKGELTFEKDAWGHGAFTYKLLQELRAHADGAGTPFTAHELYATLQRAVSTLTDGRQNPQMANHNTEGEYLFFPGGKTELPLAPPPSRIDMSKGNSTPGMTSKGGTTACVRLTTTPAGAQVWMDGRLCPDPTPCELTVPLTADTSAITLRCARPDFAPQSCLLPLTPGGRVEVVMTLPAQETLAPAALALSPARKALRVDGVGEGATAPDRLEAAVHAAHSTAVAQTLALLWPADRLTGQAGEISQRVSQHLDRFILRTQVRTHVDDGTRCQVQAHIDLDVAGLQAALGELPAPAPAAVAGPRVLVALSGPPESTEAAINQLTAGLLARGLTVLDPAQLSSARDQAALTLLLETQPAATDVILLRQRADLVITGKVTLTTPALAMTNTNIYSCQAVMSLRVIQLDSGQLLAAGNERATGISINPKRAEDAALQKATDEWLAKYWPGISRTLSDPCRTFTLQVVNLTPAELVTLATTLARAPRVRAVELGETHQAIGTLTISFRGRQQELCTDLLCLPGLPLTLEATTATTIRVARPRG